DRHQEGWNHRHQAVADGQCGVGTQCFAERYIELKDADQESGDDVDAGDQYRGKGVALVEAGGAVHGAIELGFLGDLLAPCTRLVFVNQPGIQVGIDRHLLAGHGIEGESCGNFRGTDSAVTDDDVLNGDEGKKQNKADDIVAANDKL